MHRFCLLFVVMAFASGCRMVPLINVVDSEINPTTDKEVTLELVTKAILSAARETNPPWKMKVIKPGHILADFHKLSHSIAVDITYTTKAYSIIYSDSTNMVYRDVGPDGPTIHTNYNKWVQYLNAAIKKNLYTM